MTDNTRIAFLTMDRTQGWSIDADLAFEPLRRRGWEVAWVPWRDATVDDDTFAAVYLAATWDYPHHVAAFLRRLEAIEASSAVLVNPLALVRWNVDKTYLRDLKAKGVRVVPTSWHRGIDEAATRRLASFGRGQKVIVKPAVGANAVDTFLLDAPLSTSAMHSLESAFAERAFLVQPFVHSVVVAGEMSLFYFDGVYSHAVIKRPASGDFRVQEEHGGTISSAMPRADQRVAAEAIIDALSPTPVYARVDLVDDDDGRPCLMELELVEPSLYLRYDADAPERFAAALDRYVRSCRSESDA